MPTSAVARLVRPRPSTATVRQAMFFLNYFRLAQALVYVGFAFRPAGIEDFSLAPAHHARWLMIGYLLFAIVVVSATRALLPRARLAVSVLLVLDIAAALVALRLLHDVRAGVAVMLAVNLCAGALVMPLRLALFFTALATLGMLGLALGTNLREDVSQEMLETGLLGIAYFTAVTLCHLLGRQLRASEALAEQRSNDVARLARINELIVRRMTTGVLMVDDANRIQQMNESAWMLLGNPPADRRDLGEVAPELSRRLYHWITHGRRDEAAVQLADGVPEVVPRFTRLVPDSDARVLIFLDDTSLVSRRAEELTLSSLGRLSASIAHEIRNPLAAIRYSAQLLGESEDLGVAERRMADIINNHCGRLNEIIENVLQLSRRERSQPEALDLGTWARGFVEEYRQSNDLGDDTLAMVAAPAPITVLADPAQLQQLAWNLVQNALRYGRLPGEPAKVKVLVRLGEHGVPMLEVVDRGPGIADKVAAQIFDAFYTTHAYGTGLGLYLARQMAEANQASLEYVRVAGGGSCFRLSLTPALRGLNDPVPVQA